LENPRHDDGGEPFVATTRRELVDYSFELGVVRVDSGSLNAASNELLDHLIEDVDGLGESGDQFVDLAGGDRLSFFAMARRRLHAHNRDASSSLGAPSRRCS
jgi:hypothetical protein